MAGPVIFCPRIQDQLRGSSEDGVLDAGESFEDGRPLALRCGGCIGLRHGPWSIRIRSIRLLRNISPNPSGTSNHSLSFLIFNLLKFT